MADTSSATPEPSVPSPRARSKGWKILASVVVVAIFATPVLLHVIRSAGGAPVPSNWQVFHDPNGYFTIGVPPGWTATGGVEGTTTNGNRDGSYSATSYQWSVGDPTEGPYGPKVVILLNPLPNVTARDVECHDWSFDASFDGLPASQLGGQFGWIIATNTAHYQLSYGYFYPDTANPPPPVSEATATVGTALAAQVAATFAPTPAIPIAC